MRKYISVLMILCVIVVLHACKDEENPSPEEKVIQSLAGSWAVSGGGQVVVDGTDRSGDYSMLSLMFNSTTDGQLIYTVKNGGYAFNDIAMDTWSFSDTNYNVIVRGQDQVMMRFSVTENNLTLNFTIDDPQSGRTKGMFGEFEIKLVRKN